MRALSESLKRVRKTRGNNERHRERERERSAIDISVPSGTPIQPCPFTVCVENRSAASVTACLCREEWCFGPGLGTPPPLKGVSVCVYTYALCNEITLCTTHRWWQHLSRAISSQLPLAVVYWADLGTELEGFFVFNFSPHSLLQITACLLYINASPSRICSFAVNTLSLPRGKRSGELTS